jgi:hypothetical protein
MYSRMLKLQNLNGLFNFNKNLLRRNYSQVPKTSTQEILQTLSKQSEEFLLREETLQKAKALYDELSKNPDNELPDIRGIVITILPGETFSEDPAHFYKLSPEERDKFFRLQINSQELDEILEAAEDSKKHFSVY